MVDLMVVLESQVQKSDLLHRCMYKSAQSVRCTVLTSSTSIGGKASTKPFKLLLQVCVKPPPPSAHRAVDLHRLRCCMEVESLPVTPNMPCLSRVSSYSEIGYDGGDCCFCTCVEPEVPDDYTYEDGSEACGSQGYACIDPSAECFDGGSN